MADKKNTWLAIYDPAELGDGDKESAAFCNAYDLVSASASEEYDEDGRQYITMPISQIWRVVDGALVQVPVSIVQDVLDEFAEENRAELADERKYGTFQQQVMADYYATR